METIQLIGTYKIDRDTKVKDPLVSIQQINYNYRNMMVTVTVQLDNNQYSYGRELDPFSFTDPLTVADIKTALNDQFTLKKQ